MIRPIPLKIAGVIGVFVMAFYIATAVDRPAGLGLTVFWSVLMGVASLLAWFADQFEGKRVAYIAAGLFFVLGILSPPFFAAVFLVAVLLCFVGFVSLGNDDDQETA